MGKKRTRKKAAKKKTTHKRAAKKVTGRSRVADGSALAPAAQASAMIAAQFHDFYADELKIGHNARSAQERRITRMAAMILWREEDIGALVRDETGAVWGWSFRLYNG